MSDGRTIKVYLAEGTPGGLRTAEVMNWSGHVLAASRSDLSALLSRPETQRTGVYLLTGEDPSSADATAIYIGEADDINKRLRQHAVDPGEHCATLDG